MRLLPLTLLLCACTGGLAVPVPNLGFQAVGPGPGWGLRFDDVHHGETHSRSLVVINRGTASARVSARADAPFTVLVDTFTLEPGQQRVLDVRFTASDYQSADGTLYLRLGNEVDAFTLSARVDPDWDDDGAEAVGAGGADCDDDRGDVRPGATEVCDGVDNDCNDLVDDDAVDAPTWWSDADGDGAGDPTSFVVACEAPARHVGNDDDCDDTRASSRPGANELADGLDNDCDGLTDEHLLTAGVLLFSEVQPVPDPDVPRYLEVRVRAADGRPRFLGGLVLTVDGVSTTLEPLQLSGGEVAVYCSALELDACDGLLPGDLGPDSVFILAAEVELDRVELDGWELPLQASMELDPAARQPIDNDLPTDWCASATPLTSGWSGTPGTLSGHCEAP